MPQLESLESWDTSLKPIPDFQYYIAYDFYTIDNNQFHKAPYYGFNNCKYVSWIYLSIFNDQPKRMTELWYRYVFVSVTDVNMKLLTPQFNHITNTMPSIALLPQRDELPDDVFCNNETMADKDCINNHCECHHGIKVSTYTFRIY